MEKKIVAVKLFCEHEKFYLNDYRLMSIYEMAARYRFPIVFHSEWDNYLGKGTAIAICNQLEQAVQGNIVTHALITASSFLKKRGYKVVKEQKVERQGIFLINFVIRKEK